MLYLKLLLFVSILCRLSYASDTCEAGGVCPATTLADCYRHAFVPGTNLFRHGGTAQAYKPNQPEKTEICSNDDAASLNKVASWPFTRRSQPVVFLTLKLSLWSCAADSCCKPLDTGTSDVTIEVWQTRPDGTYSSPKEGHQDGDCRAVQRRVNEDSTTIFHTLMPGSTGSMGGLGPSGMDTMPYGPSVVHVLVSSSSTTTAPVLVNIPMMYDKNTLEMQQFRWSDWRGVAWIQGAPPKNEEMPFKITSWNPNKKRRKVEVSVDLFLPFSSEKQDQSSLQDVLCPSWIYGLPSSFFLEPIAQCAPSILDFFAL